MSDRPVRLATEAMILSSFMQSLITAVGGFDAAVAVIEARWGRGMSKGTLTKKLAGQLDWSVLDILALQQATGVESVTDWMVSLGPRAAVARTLASTAPDFAREAGEAQAALMAAMASPGNEALRARAAKEVHDVLASGARVIEGLE